MRPWVITTLSRLFSLAGFELSLLGRFSGVPRGQLPAGNVNVRISHSTLNYKDALAITGKGPVVQISGIAFLNFEVAAGRRTLITNGRSFPEALTLCGPNDSRPT